MPLSKEKQRQWMKEYRQKKGGVIPNVIPKVEKPVIPEPIVKPRFVKIPRLVMEGNRIVGIHPERLVPSGVEGSRGISSNDSHEEKALPPICTQYNFKQFKAGEIVRVWQGRRLVEVAIPELDGEGNVI